MRDDERVARAQREFARRTGRAPSWTSVAPGRVNLIGEHLDYNGGVVAPFAIDRGVVIVAAPRDDGRWRCGSDHDPAKAEFDAREPIRPGEPMWANLVRGVAAAFQARGVGLPGVDLHVSSDLPIGAGLSSSAALAVAAVILLEHVLDQPLPVDERAARAQWAEQTFLQSPCGLMDQLACAGGVPERVMTIDFAADPAVEHVLFPSELAVVIADSGVRRAVNDGRYAERRSECEAAARRLGVARLAHASLDAIDTSPDLDDTLRRRARHVATENARVRAAMAALEAGDAVRCGALMNESHESLRCDFEVSCPELDRLAGAARAIGLDGGVFGSRLTGAGFGGCTVTLVDANRAATIAARLKRDGVGMRTIVSRPVGGAWARNAASG